MAKTSPTQRALAECKKRGWTPAVVEKRVPFRNITQDLFGFADLVVMDAQPGLLAVQVTTNQNLAARMAKIAAEPRAVLWLKAGLRIEGWGWRKLQVQAKKKRKKGAKAATRWALRRVSARLDWLPAEKVTSGDMGLVDYIAAGKSVQWTEVDESVPALVDVPWSPT